MIIKPAQPTNQQKRCKQKFPPPPALPSNGSVIGTNFNPHGSMPFPFVVTCTLKVAIPRIPSNANVQLSWLPASLQGPANVLNNSSQTVTVSSASELTVIGVSLSYLGGTYGTLYTEVPLPVS